MHREDGFSGFRAPSRGGGLLLALGLATPLGAAAIISVMLVAVLMVHISKGFFLHNGGYEYSLTLATAALALALSGPGSLSVDAGLGYDLSGAFWGVGAVLVGVLGGILSLLVRRTAPAENAAATK